MDGRDVTRPLLDRLVAETPHIGHDGIGYWSSGGAGMVHFHHATTPEAVNERQPFQHPRSGNVICFDGRIDNRSELSTLLGGMVSHSAPDCEFVSALYEKYGLDCLERLVGDYAFAIWQPKDRRLFCGRSPVGWRPFLWTFDGKRFGFATRVRTLIEGLAVPRALNEGAIGELLSLRFVTQTETLWQGVQRLPPGAALVLENGKVHSWFWNKGPFEDFSHASEEEHIERFRALFDDALIAVTRSITPVVSQLSGGLDSSSVVSRATELHRAGRIDRQVGAITIRYPGEPQDETEWSSAVERHLGIEAMVMRPAQFDLEAATQWCVDTLGLPLRPNVMMSMGDHLRAQGVRVLLTGEGGDDWLRGLLGHWPDLLRRGQWLQLTREASALGPTWSRRGRAAAILVEGLGPIISSNMRNRAMRPHLDFTYQVPPWIASDWARRIGLADRWRNDMPPVDLPTYAQRQRYHVYSVARAHLTVDNVVNYVDRSGIELRHPFHDLRLTRFLMGAAGGMLWGHGQRKYLLRQAMRGTLPESVRIRSTKANFVPTLIDAATTYLEQYSARDLLCVKMGWVDGAYIASAQEKYRVWRQAGCSGPVPELHYGAVWYAVAIDMWLRHAFRI